MIPVIIVLVIVAVCVFIALLRTIYIVPEASATIVERFGRYSRTLNPGLNFVIPWIDAPRHKVDLREQVMSIPQQQAGTRDNRRVEIDNIAVSYQVSDARAATYDVNSHVEAMEQLTVATLHDTLHRMDLDQALTSRKEIIADLRGALDRDTARWGIRVHRVEGNVRASLASVQRSTPKSPRRPSGLESGELIAGRYELEECLGRGGMGEVWRAHDRTLPRRVALKTLRALDGDEELLRRFQREAEIGARLQHPGITVVHDVGKHDDQPFIVMELLDGTDLAGVLHNHPEHRLPVREALDLALQATQALAAAHEQQVIHRDLKPANLFLLRTGQLKICDFGIAHAAQATQGLTVPGQAFGTPPYMAPEQWEAKSVGTGTDVYALGCVLFELLTGAPPFGGSWDVLRHAHLSETPPSLRSVRDSVPSGIDQLVASMLAKELAVRPSVATVAEQLRS